MTDLNRVLEYVNSARAALKFSRISQLPKGVIGNPHKCPIANALEDTVAGVDDMYIDFFNREDANKVNLAWWGDDLLENFNGREIHTPHHIQEFIVDFDEEKYPELIEENHETK